MNNKKLLFVVILLIPFSFSCFFIYDNNKEVKINVLVDNEIKKINLEDYIIGVVAAEMPASFQMEALKAQAIASRTFTLKKIENNSRYIFKGSNSDQGYITDTDMKKKWTDKYSYYLNRVKTAVLDTASLVITYDNALIKSYYFALSNGKTENAIYVFLESEKYLEGSNSNYDLQNTSLEVKKEFTKKEFCQKLNINCSNIIISNIKKTPSNRIQSITINNQDFLGTTIRKKLDLRSTDFNIEINDFVIITTKGYGHGVGMSQYGAHYMAKDNYNYEEIINNYYPGTIIQKY